METHPFYAKNEVKPFNINEKLSKEEFSQVLSPGTPVTWNMHKLLIEKVVVSHSFRVNKFLWFKQKVTPTSEVTIVLQGDPNYPDQTMAKSVFRLTMDEFIDKLDRRYLYINKLELEVNGSVCRKSG